MPDRVIDSARLMELLENLRRNEVRPQYSIRLVADVDCTDIARVLRAVLKAEACQNIRLSRFGLDSKWLAETWSTGGIFTKPPQHRHEFVAVLEALPSTPPQEQVMPSDLEREIAAVLNRHSAENASNTPDFILAQYLFGCLVGWNVAVQQRETWYGRDAHPAAAPPQENVSDG